MRHLAAVPGCACVGEHCGQQYSTASSSSSSSHLPGEAVANSRCLFAYFCQSAIKPPEIICQPPFASSEASDAFHWEI
ncbi:hypothetical protein CSOJ01_10177 [Colletotrichum sojae]|uniref:Uncharacterized protein n=1 Tax=Colletotrichum sojae TaxID=2175907 RepID=A0A8H6J1J9_9PEZI|nr:hypothetical protein CSOJ01_10177 [Colletotrichum sojae]